MPIAGPCVLVADDQSDVVEALRILLKNAGFEVLTAGSPEAVVSTVTSRDLDCVLMDLNYTRDTTSGSEGLDLLRSLGNQDPHLPVVVMTGWGSVAGAVERAVLVASGGTIAAADLALQPVVSGQQHLATMTLLEAEGLLVEKALVRHGGNVTRAAKDLGVSRAALYRKMERHRL